jgi:hypothetical protein
MPRCILGPKSVAIRPMKLKVAQNQFLDNILAKNPFTKKLEKKRKKKSSKKRLLGPLLSRSKLCKNGPEIAENKKNTVTHSILDGSPRKKIKFGILYAWSSGIFFSSRDNWF